MGVGGGVPRRGWRPLCPCPSQACTLTWVPVPSVPVTPTWLAVGCQYMSVHAHECVVRAGEHAVCMCVVSVRERVHVSVCVCSGKLIVFCSSAAFPTSPWRNIGPCGRAPALATVTVIK